MFPDRFALIIVDAGRPGNVVRVAANHLAAKLEILSISVTMVTAI